MTRELRRDADELLLEAAKNILLAIGEDPERAGLIDTPERFSRMWRDFATFDAGNCATTFEQQRTDQIVAVTGIRVWSICEHHLLPFYCDVAIGYVAGDKLLGLSKFARIAHKYAHRLQVQERLVEQIAEEIVVITGSESVAVYAHGEHLCATMRGARTPMIMHSSKMIGAFLDKPEARAEFLSLVRSNERP